jgi:prolyl 4-hydroxylase
VNKITQLSAEWRGWIVQNLARGCAPQSMIDDMVRANFDPARASAAVLGLMSGNEHVAKLPQESQASTYVYGTPRLPAGNRIQTHDREVQVLLRVSKPVIAVLGNVLSEAECDELIRRADDKLQRSTTVDPVRGTYKEIAERSSEGTFFEINADPFIARLDRRIAELMNCPVAHGEGLQLLHYGKGGEYRPHFDYFAPDEPGSAVSLAQGGQRVSTLVMYLNTVERGGATIFPELGLEVLPSKGSAVYFEYTNSQGQIDPLTLHGGAPVSQGEKWIVTKWMRQRLYGVAPDAPMEPDVA